MPEEAGAAWRVFWATEPHRPVRRLSPTSPVTARPGSKPRTRHGGTLVDAPLVPEPHPPPNTNPNPPPERRASTNSAHDGEVIATLLRRPQGDNPPLSPAAYKPPLSPGARAQSGGPQAPAQGQSSPQTPVQARRVSSNDASLGISQRRTQSDVGPPGEFATPPRGDGQQREKAKFVRGCLPMWDVVPVRHLTETNAHGGPHRSAGRRSCQPRARRLLCARSTATKLLLLFERGFLTSQHALARRFPTALPARRA